MLSEGGSTQHREYRRPPSALSFMARAIATPNRLRDETGPPDLAASWRGCSVAPGGPDGFFALTGLEGHPDWMLLYPHVVGFRLQMEVLTRRQFPFPIWRSLQIRNHLLLHETFASGDSLDLEARVGQRRNLEKGVEIDLHGAARSNGRLVWESVNTFYYRGPVGSPEARSPMAESPHVAGPEVARWRSPSGGGVRFGALTGDYNGIHLSDRYARLFGFRRALLHPQRVIGQCLAHLEPVELVLPVRLDVWLKGPVFYASEVALRSSAHGFALFVQGDERPAIVGRRTAGDVQPLR